MDISLQTNSLPRKLLVFVIPIGILFFYTIPGVAVYLLKEDLYSIEVIEISLLTILSYALFWVAKIDVITLYPIFKINKIEINLLKVSKLVITNYFFFMVFVAYTAPSIPLFDAISGVGIDEISIGRETFLRVRVGWEESLNYIYAIFRSFLMPFAICSLYKSNAKIKHFVLAGFLFSLVLTLEKSLSVIALVPVIFIYFQHKAKYAIRMIVLTLLCVIATSFLARGGVSDSTVENSLSSVPESHTIFSNQDQVSYILNRIIYIPYITGVDWLKYRDSILNGENANGRSISIAAWVMHEEKLNLEREVFEFQWGQNETGTGSANTAYFIDAYVNFGMMGCILYSFIIVIILRFIIFSRIEVLPACIFVPLLYLLFNSLSAMIFSGGLFITLFFAIFIKDKKQNGWS